MKTLAFALVATLASTAPAAAQVAPAYASFSKTEAILGAPSALAAILASQAAPRAPVATAAPSPASPGPLLRAATYSIPSAPVSLDRPDVFGTVALSVSRSSLDRRWTKVSHGPVGARATAYAASIATLSPLAQLDAVNRYINQRVRFTNDLAQYGVSDLWTPAGDTLRRGRGDCEDFAIAKLQMLRRAGFADKDLYLVILRDLSRRADHAVLVARAEGRLLVLDNGTSRIVDSETIADYRPILTFSGNRVWTHGYRRATPPLVLASVEQRDQSAMVRMASADATSSAASIGMSN